MAEVCRASVSDANELNRDCYEKCNANDDYCWAAGSYTNECANHCATIRRCFSPGCLFEIRGREVGETSPRVGSQFGRNGNPARGSKNRGDTTHDPLSKESSCPKTLAHS